MTAGPGVNRSVLLFESDPAIGASVSAALESEGYTVDRCSSIAERDRLLSAADHAVMLAEAAPVRSHSFPARSDIPVIVLSGRDDPEAAARASESDAFGYFAKPFDLDALIEAVDRAAIQADVRVEQRAAEPPAETRAPVTERDQSPGSGNELVVALEAWLAREAPLAGTLHARAVAAVEKPLIEHALGRTGGNQLHAAKLLGINRNTLRKRLTDLRIDPHRFARPD